MMVLRILSLVPGFQSYVTAGRQWLWLFMPAHAAVYLVMSFGHNRSGEYSKHVFFLFALFIISARTGLAASLVSAKNAPELQQI